MTMLTVRTVDGYEYLGEFGGSSIQFADVLTTTGHATIQIGLPAQGRESQEKPVTFMRDGVAAITDHG